MNITDTEVKEITPAEIIALYKHATLTLKALAKAKKRRSSWRSLAGWEQELQDSAKEALKIGVKNGID